MSNFICELPLVITPYDERNLSIRFEMGRYLYNAVLKESLVRLKLLKESKLYKKALKTKDLKKRNKLFKAAREKYKFSDYELQKFAIISKNNCDIKKHLDTHICQKIATRVYIASNEYILKKRGKPRFKRKGWISSLEGKSNKSGIRFRDSCICWNGLQLKILFDKKDKHGVQAHALNCKTKYVRIVKRKIKGKIRFFAQLIQEGNPFIKEKNKITKAVAGLDIGPSTIACCSDKKSFLIDFCNGIKPLSKKIKFYQKKIDRSRRAMNKDNYDSKKRVKRGKLAWNVSNRYKKIKDKIYEANRKLKENRKRSHNILANFIISLGNVIKTEKISYKFFQKAFGRSVNFRGPGMFLEILRRKAENAGGYVEEFNTRTTFLSQSCHCGDRKKKSLSKRWHICRCGVKAQRDLYVSFLARYVEDNYLNISQAQKNWAGANVLLEQAMLRLAQTTKGEIVPSSFGLSQRSGLLVKGKSG